MQRCYAGESFELRFDIRDPKDPDRAVDSAEFEVIGPAGVRTTGTMSVGEDGHTVKMRFIPSEVGMHRIIVSWRMGQDAWRQPHLIQVEDAAA